jgi:hypothetical protein
MLIYMVHNIIQTAVSVFCCWNCILTFAHFEVHASSYILHFTFALSFHIWYTQGLWHPTGVCASIYSSTCMCFLTVLNKVANIHDNGLNVKPMDATSPSNVFSPQHHGNSMHSLICLMTHPKNFTGEVKSDKRWSLRVWLTNFKYCKCVLTKFWTKISYLNTS